MMTVLLIKAILAVVGVLSVYGIIASSRILGGSSPLEEILGFAPLVVRPSPHGESDDFFSLSASSISSSRSRSSIMTTTITTESLVRVLPPCRIAVRNTRFDNEKAPHSEILESIAAQIPLRYLGLGQSETENDHLGILQHQHCNTSSLVFDYFVTTGGISGSWIDYFQEHLQDTSVEHHDDDHDHDHVARRFGRVYGSTRSHTTMTTSSDYYAATIEASCYCWKTFEHVLTTQIKTTCIFHESCDAFQHHPRAVWLSPHHSQYFLPTRFPPTPSPTALSSSSPSIREDDVSYPDAKGVLKEPNTTISTRIPSDNYDDGHSATMMINLCVVGSGKRKNADLLERFLEQRTTNDVMIHHFGSDPLLSTSKNHSSYLAERKKQQRNGDGRSELFESFFQEISMQCDGILPLLSPFRNMEYFLQKKKLTGSLPIIVAYQLPFLMHQELYNIYREHLPTTNQNITWETHGDSDFDPSMTRFIDRLGQYKQKKQRRQRIQPQPQQVQQSACNVRFKDSIMALCHFVGNNGANFGDELGPVVVQRILEQKFGCPATTTLKLPVYDRRVDKTPGTCLWTVGSVFHMVQSGDSIWGTGVNAAQLARQPKTKTLSNLTIHGLVRGPKSETLLRSRGFLRDADPVRQGDPGFLIPFLFPDEFLGKRSSETQPKKNTSPQFCFIPHYHDVNSNMLVIDDSVLPGEGVVTIRPDQPWRNVLESIQTTKCDYVASSSLHGLVVADAMGIPTLWFQIPNSKTKKTEGKFKYQDYLSSVHGHHDQHQENVDQQQQQQQPEQSWEKILDPKSYRLALSEETRKRFSESILESFPFHLFEPY